MVLVTAQEAPEDVTGAAGELDGGCAGGASWRTDRVPAPLGWLAPAVRAVLVPGAWDGPEAGKPVPDAGGWLVAGLVVLA